MTRTSPDAPYKNRDILYDLYIVQHKDALTIAKELGCGYGSVQRSMKKFGITARRSRKPLVPKNSYNNRDWLWNAHVVEHKSLVEIAAEAGVYHGTIQKWMKDFNIPVAKYTAERADKRRPSWQNKQWLEENYTRQRRTLDSIAEEVGCERSAVSRALKRCGIPRRPGGRIDVPLHPCNNRDWLFNAHIIERQNAVEMAKEAGVSKCTIRIWLHNHDIPVRTNEVRLLERLGTDWRKKEYLEEAYARHGRSTNALSREIGIDHKTLQKYLEEVGIVPRTWEDFKNDVSFNIDFWTEWSPPMGFVLGYAFADGCVNPNAMTMVSTDRELLEKIAVAVGYTRELVPRTRQNPKHQQQYQLMLAYHKLPEILAQYNLVPRKSLIAEMPPHIPSDCLGSFVRGNFDGDGCASLKHYHQGKAKVLHLDFTTGSEKFARQMQEAINGATGAVGRISAQTPRPGGVVTRPDPSKKIYHLAYTNTADVLRVAAFMYRGSQGLYLQRKRDKINTFVEHVASHIGDTYRWSRYDKHVQSIILDFLEEWSTIDSKVQSSHTEKMAV